MKGEKKNYLRDLSYKETRINMLQTSSRFTLE